MFNRSFLGRTDVGAVVYGKMGGVRGLQKTRQAEPIVTWIDRRGGSRYYFDTTTNWTTYPKRGWYANSYLAIAADSQSDNALVCGIRKSGMSIINEQAYWALPRTGSRSKYKNK